MDPNMTLHELRELAAEAKGLTDGPTSDDALDSGAQGRLSEIAEAMAEKFDGLDAWMARGGFLPDAWRERRDHR